MESIRQEVFKFLDDKPEARNKVLYESFPNEKQDTLRRYKSQYFKKVDGLCKTTLSYGQLIQKNHNRILVLINRTGKGKIGSDTSYNKWFYPKIKDSKKTRINHIIPLLKTFKLLPLFILKKTYELTKICVEKDYSVVEILCLLIDELNNGHYDINEISDFSFRPNDELNDFLDSVSWKKDSINTVNSWIRSFYNTYPKKEKKKESDLYKEIKGKLIIIYLDDFYGIYLYSRKKEYIIRDFSKACFINNLSGNKPISITDLIERFNKDLEFRNRHKKYFIDVGYDESPEFLNGK